MYFDFDEMDINFYVSLFPKGHHIIVQWLNRGLLTTAIISFKLFDYGFYPKELKDTLQSINAGFRLYTIYFS